MLARVSARSDVLIVWLTEITEMHRKIEFGSCVLVVRNRKMGERHGRMFSSVCLSVECLTECTEKRRDY